MNKSNRYCEIRQHFLQVFQCCYNAESENDTIPVILVVEKRLNRNINDLQSLRQYNRYVLYKITFPTTGNNAV